MSPLERNLKNELRHQLRGGRRGHLLTSNQCCTGTRSAFRRSGTRSETERNEPEFVPDFARNGTENPEFVPNFMERNGTRSEKIGTEYNTDYIHYITCIYVRSTVIIRSCMNFWLGKCDFYGLKSN